MSSGDLTLAMRLLLDARRFVSGLGQSSTALERWRAKSKSEIGQVGEFYRGAERRLAALGVSVGATALAVQSARLDKSLAQIQLTAGAGATDTERLRNELFRLAKTSGKEVEDLMRGFNSLVQSGLSFDKALATMDGINQAMVVSGANAESLAQAVTVAARAFEFDLTDPAKAVKILEQMTVGGRLGNAELEALAQVFGRVGTQAKRAGMDFEQALALSEGLSQSLPGQPEKLATRAESTLRLFTNMQYRKAAQKATGVRFFDEAGAMRNTLDVLRDLRVEYAKLTTDQQRARFVGRAFGKADQDTQIGIQELLAGDNLAQVEGFRRQIATASGIFKGDMGVALDNAVDQAGRLRATLREAADGFARPITGAVDKLIKRGLDSKEDGGRGLSGGQILGAGAGVIAGGYLAKRFGGAAMRKLLRGTGVDPGAVVTAKALEAAAGVVPVSVVNWPADLGSGIGGGVAAVGGAGKWGGSVLAAGRSAGLVGLVGAAGYAFGTLIHKSIEGTLGSDVIGEKVAAILGAFGNSEAREAFNVNKRLQLEQFQGVMRIELDDKRARVTQLKSSSPGMELEVSNTGTMWAIP